MFSFIAAFICIACTCCTFCHADDQKQLQENQSRKPPIFKLPAVSSDPEKLSEIEKLFVHKFVLQGNTVFPNIELKNLTALYENRWITPEDLNDLKTAISRYYIDQGYVNSGVIIPDQRIDNGVVLLKVIEGTISRIHVTGNKRLKKKYITAQIEQAFQKRPLNVKTLKDRLELLKSDPLIVNLHARLQPDITLGKSVLEIEIKEACPYRLSLNIDNHSPPGIGSYKAGMDLTHINLSGRGDLIRLAYGLTKGANDYSAEYRIPLFSGGPRIYLGFDRAESTVVSEPFGSLDIKSQTATYFLGIDYPIYKTLSRELNVGLKFDKRHTETSLFGEPFSFSEGIEDGQSDLSVFRAIQQYVDRSLDHVTAVRSTVSLGVDMLGATDHQDMPDGQSVSWLGEFNHIRRFRSLGSRIITRLSLRVTDSPMLPAEKFAIGGASTVRGYRENLMTTDNGIAASVEWRLDLLQTDLPRLGNTLKNGLVQAAIFFDWAKGWNHRPPDPSPDSIYSAGIGALFFLGDMVNLKIYYGYALRDVHITGEHDLQDDGIHFRFQVDVF